MRSAVAARLTAFLDAFASLRWEEFRSFFADDATVFFPRPDQPQLVEGRDGIEGVFGKVFEEERAGADGPPYLDLTPVAVRVQVVGDVALTTFELHDDDRLGRRTLVWTQQDETWRILHLHASNVPVSTARLA